MIASATHGFQFGGKKPLGVKYVQVPSSIVKNEGKSVTNNAFAMYVVLKARAFTERKSELKVGHQELKYILGIDDNRTIKDALTNLHENGLIVEHIQRLPIRSHMQVTLAEVEESPFTQLPIGTISRIKTIGTIGLRLLFLYESYIKRRQTHQQFSFPSYDTISRSIGISTATISKYNSLLEGLGLIKVIRHSIKTDNSYDDNDRLIFNRYNNHYHPILEKMVADA